MQSKRMQSVLSTAYVKTLNSQNSKEDDKFMIQILKFWFTFKTPHYLTTIKRATDD